jgi:hypothetical protein
MSRKTLLTEAEVRQFLKLANIGPVGDAKITEMYGIEEELPPEEEEDAAMDDMGDAELDMGAAEDELGGAEDELGGAEDDLGGDEMDMGAEAGGGQMVSVEDFMGALERALEDVLDDEVDVDMDAEEPEGADDLAPEDEEELGDMAMDMAADEEEPMDEDPPGMRYENAEEDIVNEVARRVAARLQAKEDKANMIDQLAEKIMKRLTSK